MKKYFTLIVMIGFISFSTLSAQSDQSEKVTTQFLQLPNYDLNSVDLGAITVEYAVGESGFGPERLKDTKSTCMPSGGGLKDAVEVTTYYYDVPFQKPTTYMVAKNGEGKVVFAEAVTESHEAIAKFGFDKCAYWQAESMKKDWAAGQSKFKSSEIAKEMDAIRAMVNNSISRNIFPSFVREELKVYSAKGKSFDYAELDKAQSMALSAYEGFMQAGPTAAGIDQLNTAIKVWEKELEELDLDNKKARINKSIAKGLYENLTNAYLYTYTVDKGIKAGIAGEKLYGNFSNDRSKALGARVAALRTHQLAINQNEKTVSDPSQLSALGLNAGKGSYLVSQVTGPEYARLGSEVEGFRFTQVADKIDANEAMHDDAVAAGEINPYERYVTETATQGKLLVFPPAMLSEELTEFPRAICQMTDLKQVTITNNKIASIPADIKRMTELKKLKLSGNQLTTLPPEIGEMSSLESLNLSNNPLTEIPSEIQNCKSLKKITLKGTQLSSDQQKQLQGWFPDVKIKF